MKPDKKSDKKYTKSKFMKSKFMESMILGASGLIAISLAGFIVYAAGKTFDMEFLSKPFIDEALMMIEFPLFFVIAALVKIIIGGKLIEFSVKYISKLLGIKKIIIAPDKPLIIIKEKEK